MDIEILDFFPSIPPKENHTISGTISFVIKPIGLIVRGHFIGKQKKTKEWSSALPARKTTHSVTGKDVRYPIINFETKPQQIAFQTLLKKKGVEFVQRWRAKNEPEYQGKDAFAEPEAPKVVPGKARTASAFKAFVEPPKREVKPKTFQYR